MELARKNCVPCRGGIPPLTRGQAEALLKSVSPEWRLKEKSIEREFSFADFKEAVAFVDKIAALAEGQGHHPDIHVFYNRVLLESYTHKIGGLHENDFILAAKIDELSNPAGG